LEHLDPNNEVSGGFPSGHTSSFASLILAYSQGIVVFNAFMTVFTVNHLYIIGIGLICIVALSRVYTAAHFFHDLAGGLAISFAQTWLFQRWNLLSKTSESLISCNMMLIGLVTIGVTRLALRRQPNGKVSTDLIFEMIFGTAAALGLFFVQAYLIMRGQKSVQGPVVKRWDDTHTPMIALIRTVFGGLGIHLLFRLAQKTTGLSKHSVQSSWGQIISFFVLFAGAIFWGYVVIMELTVHLML